MRIRPRPIVRPYDKGASVHLGPDADGLALCGRPGAWEPHDPAGPAVKAPKHCQDCETAYQMAHNVPGGRTWTGR